MAHSMDRTEGDSSSTRSGGGSTEFLQSSAMARAPAQTTLTASSSSNYASSVSSDSQIQTGGIPGTPVHRRSGGWDRQTLSPAAAAREDHVVKPTEDSSDSSDEFISSYKPMERASRSKRFFQAFVNKFTKSSVHDDQVMDWCRTARPSLIAHHIKAAKSPRCRYWPWDMGIATKFPNCSVLGVDIEPVTPPYSKPNCSFKTFDITHDWDFPDGGNFDFIHIRQLGDIQDKKKLVQSAFDNLRPGGWVEFTEWIALLQSPNHSLKGTKFQRWNELLEQGMRNFGTTLKYPEKFKPLLQEAGFERVIETRHGAPTNACYPGKKLQRIGHLMTQNWLSILEPLTMPVFTQGLGWSPDQVKRFLSDVKKEIANGQLIHALKLGPGLDFSISINIGI
ncbi:hypothetical protein FBEOM_5337 [Fusarium beomiforme]|uniref:Methyltransferase n=1 Tax=Fusarium beomiforme TaxID=44412 RepID=A0A9P5ALL9_9HYPO|nr:hypothetical protein FBEOM_5337 [Fusarium beomiforme]